MILQEFHSHVIACGIQNDIRKQNATFPDCLILHGKLNKKIKSVLIGIDIGVGEILLADHLRARGTPIDLIVSHHLMGDAVRYLYILLEQYIIQLQSLGVVDYENVLSEEAKRIQLLVQENNLYRAVDVAKILDIPLMCIHSPADNCAFKIINKELRSLRNNTLDDVLNKLNYLYPGLRPKIICGDKRASNGTFYLDIIGGNPLPYQLFENLAKANVNTIVAMHIDEKRIIAAKKVNINLIFLSHFPLDSLGLHHLLEMVDLKGELDIISCGGFTSE